MLKGRFTYLLLISSLTLSKATLAMPTWQSPYIGGYLGAGFGNNHATTKVGTVTDTSYFTTSADINAVNHAGTSSTDPSAMIAGIQAGHDWIWKKIVYGAIFDYGALSLSSSEKVKNMPYPDNSNEYSVSTTMSTDWLLTLRARLGYPIQLHCPSFFYVTGGMAITELTVKNNFSDNSTVVAQGGNDTSQNKIGWTAGIGFELASFNRMSVNFEYLYVHVPSVKVTSSISNSESGFGIPAQSLTSPFNTTGQFHANLLKIGLNYRFDE